MVGGASRNLSTTGNDDVVAGSRSRNNNTALYARGDRAPHPKNQKHGISTPKRTKKRSKSSVKSDLTPEGDKSVLTYETPAGICIISGSNRGPRRNPVDRALLERAVPRFRVRKTKRPGRTVVPLGYTPHPSLSWRIFHCSDI